MAKRHDSDGDRPRRSWREIDKMRDKGFSRQRAQEEREQERMQRSPAYSQLKAAVSKIFEGEVPDALRDKLDPSGESKAREDLMKRIKKVATEDRKAWADAVKEYVEKFEMPEDPYLLVEWLDHPRDRVIDKSLGRLEQLATAGALSGPKVPKSLDQRLRALELTGTDPDLQTRAKELRARLRG
jgi:hypothetical protein